MDDELVVDVEEPVARPGRVFKPWHLVAAAFAGGLVFTGGVWASLKAGKAWGLVAATGVSAGGALVGGALGAGTLYALSENVDDVRTAHDRTALAEFSPGVARFGDVHLGTFFR